MTVATEAKVAQRNTIASRFRSPSLVCGGALIVVIVLGAVFAPLLAPYDPSAQDLIHRTTPPVFMGGDWSHPLGTDHLGRDYLSRLLFGGRISLSIGFLAMTMSALIGTTLGLLAGYFGRAVDTVVMFLVTVRLSVPIILAALAVVALVGPSFGVLITVLGLLLWERFAVVIRSATMQIRGSDYILAARLSGSSTLRILLTEILPNIASPLIVIATLEMAHAVLLEAALSFLGLGVQPPNPSWGLMVAEAKDNILFEPWLIVIPGFAIFLLVVAINLVGDGLRDAIAPESRS